MHAAFSAWKEGRFGMLWDTYGLPGDDRIFGILDRARVPPIRWVCNDNP